MLCLQCPLCQLELKSIKRYVQHSLLHRNEVNFSVPCPYSKCHRKFRSVKGLESHVYREHRSEVFTGGSHECNDTKFVCQLPLCGQESLGHDTFMKHLQSHLKEGRSVICPFKGCGLSFSAVNAFRVHKSRKHRNCSDKDILSQRHIAIPTNVECFQGQDSHDDIDDTESVHEDETDNELVANSLAQFYMFLEAKLLVNKSTIQAIIEETNICSAISHQQRVRRVKIALDGLDIASDIREAVLGAVGHLDPFSLYNGDFFNTERKRQKYYKTHFNYVEPVSVLLGSDTNNQDCHMQYVPIRETLKAIMADKRVQQQFYHPPKQDQNVLRDISDGRVLKNNDFFSRNPSSIKILLFQDAYELVNVLGSAKTTYKALGVYFTLLNLHPEHRSKVENLQLATLCFEKHVSLFGFQAVFGPLLRDLRDLELTGIDVQGQNIKVGLACIAGDNLGQHQLGGFVANFSRSKYMCRFCLLERPKFYEDATQLGECRTPENYDHDVENANMTQEPSNGVVQECPFNELDSFHAASPALLPCIGHDLFEGFVKQDVFLCLEHFIKVKKYFTFDQLNRNIVQFQFKGGDNASAPVPVNPSAKRLSGHACEVHHFVRFIPLLFGFLVLDKEDQVWLLLDLLQEIVQYVMAPAITREQVCHLDALIKEYLELRQSLFPAVTMKPKHHYMAHYAELIRNFGPLTRSWTLRFESKHSYFKQIANRNKNYKNIIKSMAERHQLLQAYNNHCNMENAETVMHTEQFFIPAAHSAEIQGALHRANVPANGSMTSANKVTAKGTTYKKGQCIILTKVGEKLNTVGEIILALHDGTEFFLIVHSYQVDRLPYTQTYIRHRTKKETLCVKIDCMLDPWPLEVYIIDYVGYIVPKHSVC